MIFGSEGQTAWLIGVATAIFVVFLLARFNRRKLSALWRRWENLPRHIHAFTSSVLFGLLAAGSKGVGREVEFWAWSLIAAIHLAQGIYFLLNRNKPVDDSPAAERRRATLGALWSFALLLPLAWVIAQAANGAEIEGAAWALSTGAATAGALGLFDSVRRRAPKARET